MGAIDIGAAAIFRAGAVGAYTLVVKENPANGTGAITSVEIYAVSGQDLANCEVANFYVVSGDNLSTRDSETIGAVVGGSKQTSSGLDMGVTAGDYIGIYYTSGQLRKSVFGDGYWLFQADYIPCANQAFTPVANTTISLYGIGATLVIYEVSCSDGLIVGEPVTKINLTIGLSITDGLKAGDTPATQAVLNAVATDGTVLGDTPSTTAILNALASDGFKMGDTSIGNLVTTLLATDGLTLSDLTTIGKVLNLLASDGVKLSDLPSTTAILNALASDGVKLSDEAIATIKRLAVILAFTNLRNIVAATKRAIVAASKRNIASVEKRDILTQGELRRIE